MYWKDAAESRRLRLKCDRGATIAVVRPVKTGWIAEGYREREAVWVHFNSSTRFAAMEAAEEWARRQGWR